MLALQHASLQLKQELIVVTLPPSLQVQLVLALRCWFGHACLKPFSEHILVFPIITVVVGALWGSSQAMA